jgi:hypothetical protein
MYAFKSLCKVGLLSTWYGVSSGCGWRRWPPDMEGSYEYIEDAVLVRVVLQYECSAGGKKSSP